MRREMLERLHYNHLGIVKTKLKAENSVYWPMIGKEIVSMIANCDTCITFQRRNQKEPLMPLEIPSGAWENVTADLFVIHGKDYLLIVDRYSSYPEVVELRSTTSQTIIGHCQHIFFRFGITDTIFSDNGPQFGNADFKMFARKWGIKVVTSSPEHAQSNGFIERQVQTIKQVIKKAIFDNKNLCLLEYRKTAISCRLLSSSQLLFNRNIRGLLQPAG